MDLGLRLEEMNEYSDKHQSGKTKMGAFLSSVLQPSFLLPL